MWPATRVDKVLPVRGTKANYDSFPPHAPDPAGHYPVKPTYYPLSLDLRSIPDIRGSG